MRSFPFRPFRAEAGWARALALAALIGGSLGAIGGAAVAAPSGGAWLGEELPLPLAVRTPQDLAVKQVAERQYLIFNLLAGGKLAWDAGDYATAATKWEALLRLGGLDPEIDRVMRPLAHGARARAGGAGGSTAGSVASAVPELPVSPTGTMPATTPAASASAAATSAVEPRAVAVSGTLSGGGSQGPGGAVIWLKRHGGETPRPAPAKGKVITQRNKSFIPHVLAVPVGSKVDFRNEDAIFHNVFSLSRPNDFDTGLYRQGASYTQVFKKAGPAQILCNIHSSMLGYVYVVDTPYYAQADDAGAFTIKGVPAGDYELSVWHEGASKELHQRITVGPEGVRNLAIKVAGDRRAPTFLPDKSGKPRQAQLGY